MMVSTEAAERFLAAPMLADLDPTARQAMLAVLIEHRAETGAILLRQGQPNDHVAFLIEGTADVSRTRDDGRVEPLTSLAAPSVFGLTSFFRPVPPDFSVKATSPAWLLTFDHEAHELLRRVDLRAAEQLAILALRALADRLMRLDRRVSDDLDQHPADHPKQTEWARFRARLFEESSL